MEHFYRSVVNFPVVDCDCFHCLQAAAIMLVAADVNRLHRWTGPCVQRQPCSAAMHGLLLVLRTFAEAMATLLDRKPYCDTSDQRTRNRLLPDFSGNVAVIYGR